MNRETFIYHFRSGMVCKMVFTLAGGTITDWRCEWSLKLTKKRVRAVLGEYRQWRDAAFRQVQEKYGIGNTMMIETGDQLTVNLLKNPTLKAEQ